MSSIQIRPYALKNEEGQSLQALGALLTIKATSEQTGDTFNLLEIKCPPRCGTPLVIHYTEDVAIYVLEGRLTIFWGNEKKEATAGSFFFQPRGIPHGFRVESSHSARLLYMTVPAGFDRLMLEQKLQTGDADCEFAAARYKIEVLGPLPE